MLPDDHALTRALAVAACVIGIAIGYPLMIVTAVIGGALLIVLCVIGLQASLRRPLATHQVIVLLAGILVAEIAAIAIFAGIYRAP